jgi:hypothetical protein
MKTKILALTLMTGLAVYVRAQSALPATVAPVGSTAAKPWHNNSQTNSPVSDLATNSAILTNTNNAIGQSANVVTNSYTSNPNATYVNPNSTYINPNSTNVNPNAEH